MITREAQAAGIRRVALLGAGYIAEWHLRALAAIPRVAIVAVCDQRLGRARVLAAQAGGAAAYDSLDAMLAAEHVDAVHVLLPPDDHFAAARRLLRAGVHVLLEKPLCAEVDEAEELARCARELKLRLGVSHNFLFSRPFERLRSALRRGVLGRIQELEISWRRDLPLLREGPFDAWMLRDPRNVMVEVGPHPLGMVIDLLGAVSIVRAHAENAITLATRQRFYQRWRVEGVAGRAAIALNFSFSPGYPEFKLQMRGSLAAAIVDFDADTYVVARHHSCSVDFERYAATLEQARMMRRQARQTLANYALSKLHLKGETRPYGASIARGVEGFYHDWEAPLDARIDAAIGVATVRAARAIGAAALPDPILEPLPAPSPKLSSGAPEVLVVGGAGFIGRALVRKLLKSGKRVRLLLRAPGKLRGECEGAVEIVRGDLADPDEVRAALESIKIVFHLAKAEAKTWPEYQTREIESTRHLAQCAAAAGVQRFIYTGTIDSYYAGAHAGKITEDTPLDPLIRRRNLYARAKAASERLLLDLRETNGLPLVIVRPGIVIGRGGNPFHWGVGMWWYEAICQIWGAGVNPLPLVLVDDVADGLIRTMTTEGIDGESFNFIGPPLLTAAEYIDELNRAAALGLQARPTPIARFYATDLIKWAIKVAVRHPERRLPSYRDWESRTQRARFDCTRAIERLGWCPEGRRDELIRRGIREPLQTWMGLEPDSV